MSCLWRLAIILLCAVALIVLWSAAILAFVTPVSLVYAPPMGMATGFVVGCIFWTNGGFRE